VGLRDGWFRTSDLSRVKREPPFGDEAENAANPGDSPRLAPGQMRLDFGE
jgi:hypothetical protein